jgi:hypothetical protein
MNRSFIYLIFIILILACIPWADGWLFKKRYLEFIAAINHDTHLNIQVSSYRLGWLSSDAVIDVSNKEESTQNMHFTINEHIQHGPLVFDISDKMPKVAFAIIYGSLFNDQSEKILDIETRATLTGHFISRMLMQGIEWPIPFGKLIFEGLKGNSDCSYSQNHLNRCQWYFDIGALSVQSPFGTFDVSKSTYQSDMVYDPRGFWNGAQTFSFPLTTLNVFNYEIKSVNMSSSQHFGAKENSLFMTSETTSQEIFTPDITIAPLDFKIGITGFDLNGLLAIEKKSDVASVKQLLPQIFTPETLLTADLNIETNHGKCILNLKGQLSKKAFPIKNINAIANNINYEVHLRAETHLVDYLIELSDAHSVSANPPIAFTFQKQIESLQEQKLISVYAASQLKDLEKNPLPYSAYLTLIERLASTNEISNNAIPTLKSLYTLTQSTEVPASENQNVPKSQLRDQLDTWVKQGYVLKNGNEYNTSIVYQEGVFKANGLPLQNPPKLPPMSNQSLYRSPF